MDIINRDGEKSLALSESLLVWLMDQNIVSADQLLEEAVRANWRLSDAPHDIDVACLQLAHRGIPVNHYPQGWPFHLAFELTRGAPVVIGLAEGELWEGDPVLEAIGDCFRLTCVDRAVVTLTLEARETPSGNDHVLVWDPASREVAQRHALSEVVAAFAGARCFMLATVQPAPPSTPGLECFPHDVGHMPDVMGQPYEQFLEYHRWPVRWLLGPVTEGADIPKLSADATAHVDGVLDRIDQKLSLPEDGSVGRGPARTAARQAIAKLREQVAGLAQGAACGTPVLIVGLRQLWASGWFAGEEQEEIGRLVNDLQGDGTSGIDPDEVLATLPSRPLTEDDYMMGRAPMKIPGGVWFDPEYARIDQMSKEELDAYIHKMNRFAHHERATTRFQERVANDRLRQDQHEQAETARDNAHQAEMRSIDSALYAKNIPVPTEPTPQPVLEDLDAEFKSWVRRSHDEHQKAEEYRRDADEWEDKANDPTDDPF